MGCRIWQLSALVLVLFVMAPCETGALNGPGHRQSSALRSGSDAGPLPRAHLRSDRKVDRREGAARERTPGGLMGFVPNQLAGMWRAVAPGSVRSGICTRPCAALPQVLRRGLRHTSSTHLLMCLAANSQSADSNNGQSQDDSTSSPAADDDEPVKAELVSQHEEAFSEEGEQESAGDTIEVSGEPIALRKEDELTVNETSEDAETENENSEDARGDGAEDVEGDGVLSDWSRLNSEQLMREVEDLYPKNEDTSQVPPNHTYAR